MYQPRSPSLIIANCHSAAPMFTAIVTDVPSDNLFIGGVALSTARRRRCPCAIVLVREGG